MLHLHAGLVSAPASRNLGIMPMFVRKCEPHGRRHAFADSVAPAIREAQAAGAKTLRQIAAALNGRGIGTARGGKWEAATVANVLRRIG